VRPLCIDDETDRTPPKEAPVLACRIFSFALALISPDQGRMIYHQMFWIKGAS
jgi:hypothetical protein